ncbi:MAG TPA: hypothetical protein VFQ24_05230 [Terriglobia bacterium]|nr:hypothetical protein [Terriglobia bacterium]
MKALRGKRCGSGRLFGPFIDPLMFSMRSAASFSGSFRFVFSTATCFQQLLRFVFRFVPVCFWTISVCFQQLLRFVFQKTCFFVPFALKPARKMAFGDCKNRSLSTRIRRPPPQKPPGQALIVRYKHRASFSDPAPQPSLFNLAGFARLSARRAPAPRLARMQPIQAITLADKSQTNSRDGDVKLLV